MHISNIVRTAVLFCFLSTIVGCAEQAILRGNFAQWPSGFSVGGDIPGDPIGDRVAISSDEALTTRRVASPDGDDLLVQSGLSCAPLDCSVRFHSADFADPSKTMIQLDFAFRDLSLVRDQALLISVADAEQPHIPVVTFRFSNFQGRPRTEVIYVGPRRELEGHPSRFETVRVFLAPASDGRGRVWFDGFDPLRRLGILTPRQPIRSRNLAVEVRFEQAPAPESSHVRITTLEMKAMDYEGR
jgi:hypothetical protein